MDRLIAVIADAIRSCDDELGIVTYESEAKLQAAAVLAALRGHEGYSVTADFGTNSWTFEMAGDYRVGAGRYLIVPFPAAPQPEEAP